MSDIKRFMAPGPWVTRDLKECVLASDYDALRERLAKSCSEDQRHAFGGCPIANGLTARVAQLEAALRMMYDKYENGDGCYEDPDVCSGYLGSTVKLSDEEEQQVYALLEKQP